MALAALPATDNDDARLYVLNETTRTLSVLRVDWGANVIQKLQAQIPTLMGADAMTLSERIGEELFEDASRPQTAGNFNNSCGSCHFEGGDDANAWQRSNGPRSTMPMFGGRLGTGLVLWKASRINLGETGPMFGGENGGTGIFTDVEQQALVDFHETLAVPLNPNLDPVTGALSADALEGKDLFFGTNDTGLNPTLRHASCANCHPDFEPLNDPGPRFFTADFLPDILSGGENLGTINPNCSALRENLIGLAFRNVNSGANVVVDINGDTIPDTDRNSDGFDDAETYAIMNIDDSSDFHRDDPNGYMCPCTPGVDFDCDPLTSTRLFTRAKTHFTIPTKLGVFSSGPYFHDHVVFSLRNLMDPETVTLSSVYGSGAFPPPSYPGVGKLFNGEHDIRGHGPASKVQATLVSTDPDADTVKILAFIESL
jgi:hypothetical protein